MLEGIKENQAIYKPLHHSSCNYAAEKNRKSTVRQLLTEKGYDDISVDYMVQYWNNGISSVIGKWIDGGCTEDIETVATVLSKCSKWI